MDTSKCGSETVTCKDSKIEVEIELHRTKEAIAQAELRLKQVDLDAKRKADQMLELKSKVKFKCLSHHIIILL